MENAEMYGKEYVLMQINRTIETFQKKKSFNGIIAIRAMYSSVANYEVLEADIRAAKEYFYKSGCASLLYLHLYQNRYPQYSWDRSDPPSFPNTFYYAITPILLSDNFRLLDIFAQEIERLPNDIYNVKADIAIFYALKYLLIKERERAKLTLADYHLKTKSFNKGLAYVLYGILHNDPTIVEKGIVYQVKTHRRFLPKTHPHYNFSAEATAYLKLARLYGFRSQVKSPFICEALLEYTVGVVYEDIWEFYDALDIKPLEPTA